MTRRISSFASDDRIEVCLSCKIRQVAGVTLKSLIFFFGILIR
jgi:hypothetical protein